jgi:hypothetical protein
VYGFTRSVVGDFVAAGSGVALDPDDFELDALVGEEICPLIEALMPSAVS